MSNDRIMAVRSPIQSIILAARPNIGDIQRDASAVVDTELRVKGVKKLRIADAGFFPLITTANPIITVLAIGERVAEILINEATVGYIRPSLSAPSSGKG
jgi:choline dehydrogenase-like flavoprotein